MSIRISVISQRRGGATFLNVVLQLPVLVIIAIRLGVVILMGNVRLTIRLPTVMRVLETKTALKISFGGWK